MTILVIIILVLTVVALYPLVRDLLRRKQTTAPAYVEGIQFLLDGNPKDAVVKLKQAVKANPDNIDAYIRLGNIFIGQGDIERGLKVHETLTLRRNLRPEDERKVYQALVRDYLLTDRKLKAISILEELTRTDKCNKTDCENLFRLYLETGSREKCESLLKKLSRNPHDRAWVALMLAEFGRAYARTDPESALVYFNEALRLDHKSIAARLYLGDYQLAHDDTEAAIRNWHEIINLAPEKNFLVRHRLESAYYELGRYEEVSQAYERLLQKIPGDEGLTVALALIYQKKENLPAAIRLLERFCANNGKLLCRTTLASLQLHKGNPDRAGQLLSQIINQLQSERLKCKNCGTIQEEPSFSCQKCHAWLE
ncbi:hypothetical protein CH330_04395 [candidate division WOR-3 bacterium JGI_Cruoil_03_51_56]|uniref:Uncharacterized protein n=1 Tax=candidate division WOR-3 bacterium JGI_Cruoil_03_51_56 TaxID=1973747 RepID=A0A235BV02_UNCW3|nr:MAG: hypothetical protein CH330_04395 [candidate division WOR-3 bacterium JGI_Cruoil_03_51_56]